MPNRKNKKNKRTKLLIATLSVLLISLTGLGIHSYAAMTYNGSTTMTFVYDPDTSGLELEETLLELELDEIIIEDEITDETTNDGTTAEEPTSEEPTSEEPTSEEPTSEDTQSSNDAIIETTTEPFYFTDYNFSNIKTMIDTEKNDGGYEDDEDDELIKNSKAKTEVPK